MNQRQGFDEFAEPFLFGDPSGDPEDRGAVRGYAEFVP